MPAILVLNAGSSSIKFSIFEQQSAAQNLRLLNKGHVAQRGSKVELLVKNAQGQAVFSAQQESPQESPQGSIFDHDAAMSQLLAWFDAQTQGWNFAAIGHRVVHGGQKYSAPVAINEEILRELDALAPLAPLHQPHNLKVIRLLLARWPGIPQIACFDTAFHATQSPLAQACALPRAITDAGVRRYGFHGLSYEYIASQLPRVLPAQAHGKVIVAHLGNGASLCGMVNGKSVASTMGFSALDGLVMGTRCGSLDAGVVLYLLQELRMSAEQVSEMLYKQSGLLGVSGISSDMQVLLDSREPNAAQAIELFVYRITCEIGALTAAMGGLDALVFTAGIGENAAPIRERVALACGWLGAALDQNANEKGDTQLHLPASKLPMFLIPTDEELMIAKQAVQMVQTDHSSSINSK